MGEQYIEEKKVMTVEVTDEKTPLGSDVLLVRFEEGEPMKLADSKFKAIVTAEKSDATSARNALVNDLGKKMYAAMMEYGLKFSEIDPVLNEIVRLVNDGQNHANDILWGNTGYDRSLLDVNRVLLTKYAATEPQKEEAPDDTDGASSDGSTPDSENKE
jgi:hypothetical protein